MKISFLKIKKAFLKLATIFASQMCFFAKIGKGALVCRFLRRAFFRERQILCFDMRVKLSIIHEVSEARFCGLLRQPVLTHAHGVRQETALLSETITDAMRYKM